MKQKIVFLIDSGVSVKEQEEAYGIIADFRRSFEVTTIAFNGDDDFDEVGFSWEEAAGAVRVADMMVIVGEAIQAHSVADLLGEMKADCRLFVISLEPVKWPEACKGKQVLQLLRRIPVGMRRLKRWLVPFTIFVDSYGVIGYFDLKDLVEQYPLKCGRAETGTYWQERRHLEDLVEMLSLSAYYRAQIQKLSVAETLENWVEEAPLLRQACDSGALRQALEACKMRMGNFMLVRIPKETTSTLNGQVYKGIEGIKQADGNGTVFSSCHLFPCFDSSDYAYENRYYRNYWFCGQNASARAIVQSLKAGSNNCCIGEHLPKESLPMVYYEDGRETMLVAYEKPMNCL